jgi:hypothetical protein
VGNIHEANQVLLFHHGKYFIFPSLKSIDDRRVPERRSGSLESRADSKHTKVSLEANKMRLKHDEVIPYKGPRTISRLMYLFNHARNEKQWTQNTSRHSGRDYKGAERSQTAAYHYTDYRDLQYQVELPPKSYVIRTVLWPWAQLTRSHLGRYTTFSASRLPSALQGVPFTVIFAPTGLARSALLPC